MSSEATVATQPSSGFSTGSSRTRASAYAAAMSARWTSAAPRVKK